ncbi:MAG: tetratricopeptide repeat protein [Elusimicrobia bacterium]|nr:tetratricopeptide repeat protein [Elusimicrobiota bacterium]
MQKHAGISGIVLLLVISLNALAPGMMFTKDEAGTTGAAFLKLTKGVRMVGMGEACCAVNCGADSVYSNPAGLNYLERINVSAMHSIWFEDIFFDFVTAAVPTSAGVFSMAVNYLGMDEIDMYYNTGVAAMDTYKPYDLAVYTSYANIIKGQALGINLKFIRSVIEDESASAVAMDAGYMRKSAGGRYSFGAAVQNMGTKMKFKYEEDPLPFNIKTGISADFSRLTLAGDLNFPVDNIPSAHAGIEYRLYMGKIVLAARSGYRTNPINDLDALAGLSAGGGIGYSDLRVDYSWVPYGDLGQTHRISLAYMFPSRIREDQEEPRKKVEIEGKKEMLTEDEILVTKRRYFIKGQQLLDEGRYEESIIEFRKVLTLDPGHFESLKYIEIAEDEMKKADKSR